MKKSLLLIIVIITNSFNLFAQQTKAYALIVGLKSINDQNYKSKYNRYYDNNGTEGVDKDCTVMENLLKEKYVLTVLRDKNATRNAILSALEGIGKQVANQTGKVVFMFYYSGHGDTIPDRNKDEASKYDQALVAYDDFVIDDEIYTILKKYFSKSENIMIVDACHSGSSYKMYLALDFMKNVRGTVQTASFSNEKAAIRSEPDFAACNYDHLETISEPFNLIYVGATGDNDLAGGGSYGGTMTYWLDKVIRDAKYHGDWKTYTYRTLACRIAARMIPSQQYLTYREIGETVNMYVNNQPFKIY